MRKNKAGQGGDGRWNWFWWERGIGIQKTIIVGGKVQRLKVLWLKSNRQGVIENKDGIASRDKVCVLSTMTTYFRSSQNEWGTLSKNNNIAKTRQNGK